MHKEEGSENPVLFFKVLKVVKSKGDKDNTCAATLRIQCGLRMANAENTVANCWKLQWTV